MDQTMTPYKMLVFDVDGTLYDLVHHEIPESCKKAIREAKQRGYLFVIATGRAHYGLGRALMALEPDYILAVNGGVVVDKRGNVISHHDFSKTDVEQLLSFCHETQAGLLFKFLDHMYIYQHPEKIDWLEGQMHSDIGMESFITHREQTRHLTHEVQSASIHAPVEDVERVFQNSTTISFLRYSQDGYDVVPKGLHKGVGLQELMSYLQIKKEEVVCFGDNFNDIEMMQTAGFSVAMGNAIPEIKALADYITTTTDQNGIYKALQHLGCID